jgi:hypothetical protein
MFPALVGIANVTKMSAVPRFLGICLRARIGGLSSHQCVMNFFGGKAERRSTEIWLFRFHLNA